MRISGRIALALLLASVGGGSAQAGLRAVYFDASKSKQLVIEVADNGDARIGETDSGDYGLLIGGKFMVVGDQEGKPMVARIEDIGAAIDRVVPPIFHDMLRDPSSAGLPRRLQAKADGEQMVGGQKGRVYHISGFAGDDPAKPADYVISTDPALAPVGHALEQFMNAALVPAAVLMGPAIPELLGETREIFALGTPIDISGRFRLDRVETVDVPASRLALPAAPATVDALVETMKADAQENAHR
jgi:hypothetical protein